jgi:hypothetical protein
MNFRTGMCQLFGLRRTTAATAVLAALLLPAMTGPGRAQEHWHDEGHEGWHDEHGGPWHHYGDIHHFHEHDVAIWRGGHWFHGDHDGRLGWWWIVEGSWYFYPAPIYPYPDPYLPPTVAAAPRPTYWYCNNPAGYYPYVPQCAVPWQPVTPPPS